MSLATAALDLLHRHPGRKRKSRIRMAGNRSPRETVADIVSIAKAQRIKMGASEENALDYRLGSTIGQIWYEGSIDDRQHDAAQRYLRCVISAARLHGIPSPHPRSAALLMAGRGLSCDGEFPDELANEIKGRFRDCRRALLEAGAAILVGSRVNRIVYGVVVENWPRMNIGNDDIQNLRCGLNALARVLG